MSVVIEEIVIAFHLEILFEVFCDADNAITLSRVQKKGNLLQISSLFEMDDVLDAVDQFRQERDLSLEGLDVLMVS